MNVRSPWLLFSLVAVAQFMVVLDVVITNVALPAIQASLHFDAGALQWVVTAYAITFGGFLLLGGRASDIFGHRRVLLFGLGSFTLCSFLIGISQTPTMLIVLRAFQGISAALMSPAALSVVLITFAEGKERNRALGHWTTVATGGAAVGLLLGGVLTQLLDWRWNFFINIPIGILVSVAIARLLPHEPQETEHHNLDLPGAALVTSGLILFVFVASKAPVWGWTSIETISSALGAMLLLGAFIWNESVCAHPLIPLSIFRVRNITGANLMSAPISAGSFGMFFLLTLYIQNVLHYSPIMTGLSFLPFPIILGTLSQRMAKGVTRYGTRPFLLVGPMLVAVGVVWLARLPVLGNYWTDLLPTVLLMPIGMAMTFMPLMVSATSGVGEREAGLASGLINTSQQMGGALGLAILASVAGSVTMNNASMGAMESLVSGYHAAFMTAAVFIVIATILGATIIRQKKNATQTSSGGQVHGM